MLCQPEEQLVGETKKTQHHATVSSDTAGASLLVESPQMKVRLRQQLERRGAEATEAVAASVGTGTYSSVIPEPRLRSSALHPYRSQVLVSVTFSS